MTTDACATPGCGHAPMFHGPNGCDWEVRRGYFDPRSRQVCGCTAYLPPRPVPEEDDDWPFTEERPRHLWEGNFTPPDPPTAPHAEAEAERLLPHLAETLDRATCRGCLPSGTYQSSDGVNYTPAKPIKPWFVRLAGYLRGRGDRG